MKETNIRVFRVDSRLNFFDQRKSAAGLDPESSQPRPRKTPATPWYYWFKTRIQPPFPMSERAEPLALEPNIFGNRQPQNRHFGLQWCILL